MAEQRVTLNPSEAQVISFEAMPKTAKTYHVSVNGLTGSFVAKALILELPDIDILNVEGRPFIEVGKELKCTLADWAKHLYNWGGPIWPSPWVSNAESLYKSTSALVNPCTATREELENALLANQQYLSPPAGASIEDAINLILNHWFEGLTYPRVPIKPKGDIAYATLAEPIIMGKAEPITLSYYLKRIGQYFTLDWRFHFEPQFLFKSPNPVGYRASSSGNVAEGTVEIGGRYSVGYFELGIYNGVFRAELTEMAAQLFVRNFRIKNMAKITRAGMVTV